MDPLRIAQLIMSYYLKGHKGRMPITTNLESECEDNEVRLQILLSIYTEMHNIWYEHPNITEESFIAIIHSGFESLGYKVHIVDPDELVSDENIIHYASIKPDGIMTLNPFHPFHIAELIRQNKEFLPASYRQLLMDIKQLPYIVTFHYYSNYSRDIVTFEKLYV